MIWTIVVVIVGYILIRFFISLSKDNDDLQGRTLDDKFNVIVNMINEAAFNGCGSVTTLDKREFNLYEEGQNQIIKFQYSTGHLTITWKYKYFQKEVVHERQFNDVRNLSLFEQQKIGEQMIKEMAIVVERHRNNVIGGI
ncbi:hypothetical protein [Tannerella forsythia]|uniref:Uncharacterized protein n=1 Tax=Tannerella forsythia TaxID=28112 RepID=A0A3P1XKE2_TANFO|nr:hypothetical protein [Tannerella forsythia]RRD58377.1 hypothetical protein EII40_12025 [Tannerella forsythia]